MQDTEANFLLFLEGLNKMGELFRDPLSEQLQIQYWELLGPRVSAAEWDYACWEARSRETFHKVPLPQVLWQYVLEYRANCHDEESWRETRQLAAAPPLRVEDALQEVQQIIAALRDKGGEEAPAPARPPHQGPLHPAYRAPETDLLARKHQLHQQAAWVEKQEPLYEP